MRSGACSFAFLRNWIIKSKVTVWLIGWLSLVDNWKFHLKKKILSNSLDKRKAVKFISCHRLKGVLHPWALFLKTLCIFSKNKATSDKVSYGSGQKCSKELKNHSFTSVETIVVKLQWKMCENQYFSCFEP